MYADIESLLKKINNFKNNPEKFKVAKSGKQIPCQYSMTTIWVFDHIENKHCLYCEKYCIKKLSKSLRQHAKNKIDFGNKMLPLTKNN